MTHLVCFIVQIFAGTHKNEVLIFSGQAYGVYLFSKSRSFTSPLLTQRPPLSLLEQLTTAPDAKRLGQQVWLLEFYTQESKLN